MRIFILVICIFNTIDAVGCSCGNIKKKQLIKGADLAVVVEVIETVYRTNYPVLDFRPDVRVRVLKVIKGEITKTEILVISSVALTCSENFVIGRKYLIAGTNRLSDYYPDESDPSGSIDDSLDTSADSKIPRLEPYDKYLKRVTEGSRVIFTDMCRTINY